MWLQHNVLYFYTLILQGAAQQPEGYPLRWQSRPCWHPQCNMPYNQRRQAPVLPL